MPRKGAGLLGVDGGDSGEDLVRTNLRDAGSLPVHVLDESVSHPLPPPCKVPRQPGSHRGDGNRQAQDPPQDSSMDKAVRSVRAGSSTGPEAIPSS